MARIVLDGWREGFEKISLAKLQIEMLGKSLTESKLNVDFLLDDGKVIIELDDFELAKTFLNEAEKIGVSCKFLEIDET